jgi:hypothetical protein
MKKNLAANQMYRAYVAMGKKFRNEPGLSTLFGQIEQIRPEIFTLGGFFSGTMRLTRGIMRYLKRNLRSRLNRMP